MTDSPLQNNQSRGTERSTLSKKRQVRPKLQPVGSIVERSGLVIVDKPSGMSSHDVVARLRGIMGTKKVGHSGTLDPLATGVLVVGVERGTKFLAHVVTHEKSYDAVIRLGISTVTDDSEGDVLSSADPAVLSELTEDKIRSALLQQVGDIMQRPSSVSAIKINGRRAHELVRAGEEVILPARPVTVHSLDIHSIDFFTDATSTSPTPHIDIHVSVHCSSGTYIRSIARDVGIELGVGGHIISLRRTSVGPFSLSEARTLEELQVSRDQDEQQHQRESQGQRAKASLSLTLDEAMTRCFPTRLVNTEDAHKLSLGQWLQPVGQKDIYAAVTQEGTAVALIKEQGKRAAVRFVARPSTL